MNKYADILESEGLEKAREYMREMSKKAEECGNVGSRGYFATLDKKTIKEISKMGVESRGKKNSKSKRVQKEI